MEKTVIRKPVKVWIIVLLSLIPIGAYFGFAKIKSFRKIALMNLIIYGIVGLATFFIFPSHTLSTKIIEGMSNASWGILVIDAILAVKWAMEWNRSVKA